MIGRGGRERERERRRREIEREDKRIERTVREEAGHNDKIGRNE